MENTTVVLNGKSMTLDEFNTEKQKLTEKKIKIISVGNNEYKTRLQD